jgi:hypothetical protein
VSDYANPYSNPEIFGLVTVGSAQWGEADWNFNLTAVWRDPNTGQLYWADDSGCSCPSPFEDITDRDGLTAATKHEVLAHLAARATEPHGDALDCADLVAAIVALPAEVTP